MNLKIFCLSHLEPIDQFVLSSLSQPEVTFVKPERRKKIIWDSYSLLAQKYILRGLKFHKIRADSSADYERAILNSESDLLITCDAPILSAAFLEEWRGKAVNIHFGISKKYRGTHTVFWPLLNGDFDSIGLTFHIIDRNIDTGAVILEYYPALEKGDSETTIWRKLAVAAHHLLPQVCTRIAEGEDVNPGTVHEKGILCLSRQRTLVKELHLRYLEWTGKLKIHSKDESTVWYI